MTTMKIKGAVIKKQLVLDIETGGQTRTEKIQLASPPYLSPNIKPAILLMGLETGKTYRFPLFNPATMSTEETDDLRRVERPHQDRRCREDSSIK